MDHALVQHLSLRLASCALLALFACARNEPAPNASPSGPAELWVSPSGNDSASGTNGSPLLTVAAALALSPGRIVLLPGAYAGPLTIDRSVSIEGADQGAALLRDRVTVLADRVSLSRVNLGAGLTALKAKHLVLEHARIDAGAEEDAIHLGGTQARLDDLELLCGAETCLEISTSTVQLTALTLKAAHDTRRGLVVETSSVTAKNLAVSGTQVAQVQLGRWAKVSLDRARLEGGRGSGLIALRGAQLRADSLTVEGAARFGLTLQGASATLSKLEAKKAGLYTVGIAGGAVEIVQGILESSPEGVVSLGADRGRVGRLTLVGGEVRHGIAPAVLIRDGVLRARGVAFKGAFGKAGTAPTDAITASGFGARVEIDGCRFESPSGHAIALLDNAAGTITATITGPGQGGIYAEDVIASPIVIKGSRISNCLTGSGITLFECEDVTLSRVRITGCKDAGVMAGQGSKVRVERSNAFDNPLYGFAAFGNAQLRIFGSGARGSKWATFSTCGEGGEIEDQGANRFIGATTRCP